MSLAQLITHSGTEPFASAVHPTLISTWSHLSVFHAQEIQFLTKSHSNVFVHLPLHTSPTIGIVSAVIGHDIGISMQKLATNVHMELIMMRTLKFALHVLQTYPSGMVQPALDARQPNSLIKGQRDAFLAQADLHLTI